MSHPLALLCAASLGQSARACTLCDTDVARQVRAEIFSPTLAHNAAVTLLPLAVLALLTRAFYTGRIHFWPPGQNGGPP